MISDTAVYTVPRQTYLGRQVGCLCGLVWLVREISVPRGPRVRGQGWPIARYGRGDGPVEAPVEGPVRRRRAGKSKAHPQR